MSTEIKFTFRAWLAEQNDSALPPHPARVRVYPEPGAITRLRDLTRRAKVRLATVRETPICRCPHGENF